MSFAEIKKSVNTDLNTPLNHLSWLNDYKVFGNESYVFRNKAILNELYHSYTIVMNDESIYKEAFDAIAVEGSNVGKALAAINGIDSAETLKTLSAMNAVANSATAMNAVANSATAMNAVLNSATAMNAVLNSATAMNAVAKGTAKWTTAVKKTFFTAINNSPEMVKSVYNILTNNKYFTNKISTNADGVSSLDQYGTTSYAKNGLVACCLGCYEYNSQYTLLHIDGEQVAKNNSYRPGSVAESNVNAIACPTATFTESGDGYAAIEVYIAI